jgi:hypothetical protein
MTQETTTIGGPVSMSYYEVPFGGVIKKILLFGDRHVKYTHLPSPSVIPITTLIKKLIRQCHGCVDLFVERQMEQLYETQIINPDIKMDQDIEDKAWDEYMATKTLQKQARTKKTKRHLRTPSKSSPKTQTGGKRPPLTDWTCPLAAVRDEFGLCPLSLKMAGPTRRCSFDNLRYHNWDLRLRSSESPRVLKNSHMIKGGHINLYKICLQNWWGRVRGFDSKTIAIDDMIKYLLGFDVGKRTKKKIDEIFESVIERELMVASVSGKEEADRLIEAQATYQVATERVVQREYKKMMASNPQFPHDFLETFMKVYGEHMKDAERDGFQSKWGLVFTDFYLLCRMFTTFSATHDKSQRTPRRCPLTKAQQTKTKQPTTYKTPQHIMLYAGFTHSHLVSGFLQEMFSVRPLFFAGDPNSLSQNIHIGEIETHPDFTPETLMGMFEPFLAP